MQSSVQVPVNNRHRCGLWTSLADRCSTNRHRPRQSNNRHARVVSWAYEMWVVNDSHRRHSTHHPSIMNGVNGPWSRLSWRGRAMIARRHAAVAIGLAVQSIDTGWRSAAGAVQVLPTPQPITLAADATSVIFVLFRLQGCGYTSDPRHI